jgi:hypothetical protein
MVNKNISPHSNQSYFSGPAGKKAQIQVTFSWVYILIAGAVILLFFIGIVVKQKSISEENLATDVVRVMESIFTGAGVSEKTKNFVDISGLADYTLYFNCEEGTTDFGIKDRGKPSQNSIDPIFAPLEIQDTELVLWSLPYKLPFKVIDFTFVTASKTKYYFLGNDDFVDEFINSTEGFGNIEKIDDILEIDPQRNYQFRIVDFSGGEFLQQGIPSKLGSLEDSKLTAIVFTGTHQVDYYQKLGNTWDKLNKEPVKIISIPGERDAAKYAVIFSGNDETYKCNMQKAFTRLKYVLDVYDSKLKEMEIFYEADPALAVGDCYNYIKETGADPNARSSLDTLKKSRVPSCLVNYPETYNFCLDLLKDANKLKEANKNLGEKGDCLTLY